MVPKSQAKIKPQFLQYPFLTIFNPKKVWCEQIYVLSFNHIMIIYSNVYNYAIYTLDSFCALQAQNENV